MAILRPHAHGLVFELLLLRWPFSARMGWFLSFLFCWDVLRGCLGENVSRLVALELLNKFRVVVLLKVLI